MHGKSSWLFGTIFSESMELVLVFSMFILVLAAVYFLQRYIGDY